MRFLLLLLFKVVPRAFHFQIEIRKAACRFERKKTLKRCGYFYVFIPGIRFLVLSPPPVAVQVVEKPLLGSGQNTLGKTLSRLDKGHGKQGKKDELLLERDGRECFKNSINLQLVNTTPRKPFVYCYLDPSLTNTFATPPLTPKKLLSPSLSPTSGLIS